MVDNNNDMDSTQTTNSAKDVDSSQVTDGKSSVTVNVHGTSQVDLLQTPEGKALAAKLRKEEKDKLYARMSQLDAEKKAMEEKQNQLLTKQQELETQLKKAQEEKSNSSKDVETQLAEMRAKLETANSRVDVVMEEAAKLVRESEAKAYREKRLAEEGIMLKSLIPMTDDLEAIDKAIEEAKKQQQAIEEQARTRLREELGAKVPTPLAPEQQNQGPIESMASDPRRRRELTKLSRDEYQKVRDELLKKAEQATGWKR